MFCRRRRCPHYWLDVYLLWFLSGLSQRFSVRVALGLWEGVVRVAGMRLVPQSPTTNPKDEMGSPVSIVLIGK